jgi:hypothetical protein
MPQAAPRIRIALRYLLERDALQHGDYTKLARVFGVTRERVRQIADEERVALTPCFTNGIRVKQRARKVVRIVGT